ncbi:hypothetical protein MANES_01G039232v8 [Manihot esculenta]|uniref:Uncharacterized protein n=1 Tax=Manihot esculenta TaxID=3983 RepID=A0ACB7IC27_MANES|nr:hypothetical protein MANES_01G039232v8 [Manihot esculenta]
MTNGFGHMSLKVFTHFTKQKCAFLVQVRTYIYI